MALKFEITGDNSNLLHSLDGARSGVHRAAEDIERSGKGIEETFKRIGEAAGIAFSINEAKNFIGKVVEMRSFFQDIESSMKVFLGNEEKATEFTNKLKDYAYYNMFEFKDLAAASQQMIAYGHAIDDIIPRLDQLSNVAVGTHGNLMELVSAYNKAKSTGVVDAHGLQSWAVKGVVIKDVLKEMGEEVTNTSVTFEQLNKVLDHVTGEGGMFHDLQLSMMENISAEIGQFEDNFNAMLNEIGEKYQDYIIKGIKAGSELVDNYQTIAKYIQDAVVAIGLYKSALVVANVVEKQVIKTKEIMAVQEALLTSEAKRLAAARGISVAAARAELGSVNVLTAAKIRLTAVTNALTASMMKNPYTLVAVAVAALIFGIYKLATAESAAEKGTRKANEELERQAELLENQKNAVQDLISVIQDETQTETERISAYNKLKTLAPGLTKEYTRQELATKDLDEITKKLNEDFENLDFNQKTAEVQKWTNILNEVNHAGNNWNKISKESADAIREMFGMGLLSSKQKEILNYLNTLKADLNELVEAREEAEELSKPIELRIQEANENTRHKKAILDFYDKCLSLAADVQDATNKQDYTEAVNRFDEYVRTIEKEVADLKEKSDKNPLDMKLRLEYQEKQKLQDELKKMREGFFAQGLTTIPVFFKLNYEKAKEDYEKDKNSHEGMRFDSPTGTWVPIEQDTAVRKTATEWRRDFESELKEAKKELDDFNHGRGKYKDATMTREEREQKAKELSDRVSNLKKQLGTDSTKSNKDILKKRKEQQEYLELIEEQKKERERAVRDLNISTTQAEIDAMNEGAEKTARQMELDYLKKDLEIERAFEDLKDKKIAEAKKLWEANPANEGKLFDESSVDLSYTEEELNNFLWQLAANEAEYTRKTQEFNKEHARSMREFLKEYGDELQQELAITEEYQEKIEEARASGDEGTALILEKKLQEVLSDTKLQNLQSSPEYIRAFEDLTTASSETLKSLIKKFEDAKEAAAKSLDPYQLREYTNTLQQMYDELESRNPFDTLVKSLKEVAKASKDVKEAQELLDAISAGQVIINEETGKAYTEEEARIKLTEAKDNEAKVYTKLTKATTNCADKLKSFAGILSNLGEQIGGNFGNSLGAVGSALGSVGDAFSNIQNFNVNATGLSKAMGQFSAVAGTVSAMISMNKTLDSILPDEQSIYERHAAKLREINEIHRQMLELEIAQLQQRLDNESWVYENGLISLKKNAKLNAEYINAYAEAAAAPQEIYKEKKAGIMKALGAIVGAIVGIVAAIFTFGAGAGLGAVVGTAIGTAVGATAIGAALGAGTIAAIGAAVFAGVGAAIGNAVRSGVDQISYNEGETAAINNMRVQTRHRTFFRKEKTQDLESWVKENYKQDLFEKVKAGQGEVELIDPEVAKKLLEDGPVLVGETRKTLETLLDYSEKIRDFIDQVREYVSEAFSPLVDNLTDALWDWLSEGKDVMDSFRGYASDTFKKIAQEALKTMVSATIFEPFQEQLEDLAIAYGTGQVDETMYMAGVAEFARQAQTAIETQLPMLQNAAEVMKIAMEGAGIDIAGGEYQQQASSKGFQAMGQDTADELNGRFTALQIAGENIAVQAISIYEQMIAMTAIHTSSNNALLEIRNLMITNNSYLDDVAKYSKKIYNDFAIKMDEMVTEIKRI